MKRESLSERLIRVCEEKTKLECENQRLKNICVEWQKACELRDKCINDILEDKRAISDERHQTVMENIELEEYVRAAKSVFKQCEKYIYTHRNEFAISNYDIEKLGLHGLGMEECKEQPTGNISNGDDILELFKQSSQGI